MYFDNENATKRKGTIDLKAATELKVVPDAYYNYEDAFTVITASRNWVMCPESHKDQQMWLDAIRPMIGGSEAGEGGTSTETSLYNPAGNRRMSVGPGGRMSMVVQQTGVKMKGWLERAEDDEWQRRYFILSTCLRDGVQEGTLEYYLDEELTEDEDSETFDLEVGSTKVKAIKEKNKFCFQLMNGKRSRIRSLAKNTTLAPLRMPPWPSPLTPCAHAALLPQTTVRTDALAPTARPVRPTSPAPRSPPPPPHRAGGESIVLNADEDAERDEWIKAITEVLEKAAVKPPKIKMDASATSPGAPSPGEHWRDGQVAAAARRRRVEPEGAATIHSGWMSKKGEGMLAKWQQRWFVLLDNKDMHYFEDEECASHKGVVQMQSLKKGDIKRNKSGSSDYSFTIATPGRKWALNPGTEAAYDEWEKQLLGIAA